MSHVHVALRMRPPKADNSEYVTIVPPGMIVLTKPGDGEMFHFQYNNAMLAVDNQTVYDSVARQVVDAVLDGYNGTLLAYGQTGKTFTMLGPGTKLKHMSESEQGCMPRAMSQIFQALGKSDKYTSWKMQLSYIEVYLDKIYDLLRAPGTPANVEGDVTVSKDGVARLKNIMPTAVESLQDVERLIERGQDVRQQADNGINARSSRSHTILTVWLQTTTSAGSFATKLNLVDLAGSERRGKMGDQGKKIHQEGDAINQSLLTLQRVVMSLGRNEKPSFRESKLTRFLQDSLGGNCKTALIACAWGEPDKSSETLSTCKFAESMTKVVVNAKKNAKAAGNKIRIDPVMMAMMEERIRQRVEEEKRKLETELRPTQEAPALSPEEIKELEEYRKKFAELEVAKQKLAKTESKMERADAKVPSEVQSEIQRLRRQLQEKNMELEEVNADLKRMAAAETSVSKPGNLDDDSDSPTVDESVETFAKLKRVQPKQQELQRKLEVEGSLDEDDAEALDYLNDEVQSLLEILQQHGFNIPGMTTTNQDDEQEVQNALQEEYSDNEEDFEERSQQGALSSRSGLAHSVGRYGRPRAHSYSGGCNTLPVQSEPCSPEQHLTSASQRHQPGTISRWGSQIQSSHSSFGGSSRGIDRNTTMDHLTSVPNNLIRPQPSFLGKLGASLSGRFGAARQQRRSDDLTAVNRLQQKSKGQRVQDMVFLSPLDYNSVTSQLQGRSEPGRRATHEEVSLDRMPQMPP